MHSKFTALLAALLLPAAALAQSAPRPDPLHAKAAVAPLVYRSAFGGYKSSGIGRENHLMMLDHYQQTKNLLVSYSEDAQGFF